MVAGQQDNRLHFRSKWLQQSRPDRCCKRTGEDAADRSDRTKRTALVAGRQMDFLHEESWISVPDIQNPGERWTSGSAHRKRRREWWIVRLGPDARHSHVESQRRPDSLL